MNKSALLILGLFFIQALSAQQQITCFSAVENDYGSSPSDFREFKGLLFFEAQTEEFGREIWVSNGDKNGASLLKDIYPRENSGINSYFGSASVNFKNSLYFIASDESSEGEIWKTDGTTKGTVKVTHFLNHNISALTLVDDMIYFLIHEGDSLQVWTSDGTEAGTEKVIGDMSIWGEPSYQGEINNTFIFTFRAWGIDVSRVWRSDGTSTGTFPLTGEIDRLKLFIESDNELFFVLRSRSIFGSSTSLGIMKTDGTLENTVPVKAVHDGSSRLIDKSSVVEADGKLYFSFYELDYKRQFIWESDGTEEGTKKIYDVVNDRDFMTSNLSEHDNKLVFCGANPTGGTSLLKLNLEDYSADYIMELQDSTDTPGDLCILRKFNDEKLFLSVPVSRGVREGWLSDYTEMNTIKAPWMDMISSAFLFGGSFFFANTTELEGSELWKSDGTETGTFLCDNIDNAKFGINHYYATNLVDLNSQLIFNANNGKIGDELWTFQSEDTTLLRDIGEGSRGSHPRCFTMYNNELYYMARDYLHSVELWKTDGTAEGTQIVDDQFIGETWGSYGMLEVHKGVLFFIARVNSHYFLCKTNGTGVEMVKAVGDNSYGSPYKIVGLKSSGDYIYFTTEAEGEDLWISDGTEEGTFKLKDFTYCRNLTDFNGQLCFSAADTAFTEMELWKTDGTGAGTLLVKDIGMGQSSSPGDFLVHDESLYFTAFTVDNGREVWNTDGTEEGTFQIADIYPGQESSVTEAFFCAMGNTIYFSANDGEIGFELWKTDGTEAGTSLVKDVCSGIEGSYPAQMTAIKNLFYFQAYDSEHGIELWQSDGTADGTMLVEDLVPGNFSSDPDNFLGIGDDVFFVAGTPDYGRQIWKMAYNEALSVFCPDPNATFSVYPNPCTEILNFNVTGELKEITIFDITGKLVSRDCVIENQLDISSLPNGLYILKATVNSRILAMKILKQ